MIIIMANGQWIEYYLILIIDKKGRRGEHRTYSKKKEKKNKIHYSILHYMTCRILPAAKRLIWFKTSRTSKFSEQLNLSK